jgi:RNA polymerase sigma-70 factor (ECF subfamily)
MIDRAGDLQGVFVTVPDTASEVTLVERARRGDHGAFASLVDARLASTFRTVMAILGNEADARDATQAIFVRTWSNLPTLREPAKFQAWFGRIVVNTCRSTMRGRQRQRVREIPVGSLPDGGESLAMGSADHAEASANLDVLERALDRLAPAERTLLWLHHYEELSLAEIGERLEIPPKTVKSRLFTARRALERALQAERR